MSRMKSRKLSMAVLATMLSAQTTIAHEIAWRQGEPRIAAFGTCAKGPCAKRASFATTKPHRHIGAQVVVGQISSRPTTASK
ncbi:MAG: hypothetical protein NW216_09190 [Hyphomicrobium sp.]|nr:hypothetical protein [Hyphomicrobium sp.]